MHSQIPGRLSVLYASAILVGVITIFLYCFFIWDTQIAEKDFDVTTTAGTFLLATPFIGSSILLILFIKRNYPSIPINQILRIFYFISLFASTALQVLFFYNVFHMSGISKLLDRLYDLFDRPRDLVIVSSVFLMMVLQLLNNIEGIPLLKIIRRNNRTEYNESF